MVEVPHAKLVQRFRTEPDRARVRIVVSTEIADGMRCETTVREHTVAADEPRSFGGTDAAQSPVELLLTFWESRPEQGNHIGDQLRGAAVPVLLVQHKGCLLYTDEGFQAAVDALPHAQSERLHDKPSTSPEFAGVLEAFCREHVPISI